MKITIEVSEKNEGTTAPWWVIIDPKRCAVKRDYNSIANAITGPFFSRETAEVYLKAKSHNFSDKAITYCMCAVMYSDYREQYEKGWNKLNE